MARAMPEEGGQESAEIRPDILRAGEPANPPVQTGILFQNSYSISEQQTSE
jgi:hypothetical protein